MNQTVFIACCLLAICCINGCNSGVQSDAAKQSELINKTIEENSPGSIATGENGYYMKAKLDGKEWSASHMMPHNDERSSFKMIHAENAGDVIKLQLWKKRIEVGKKVPFSETNMANLFIEGDPNMYGGQSGEIEIIKFDDKWIEGTFHFTARSSSSGAEIEVTEGRFRIEAGL